MKGPILPGTIALSLPWVYMTWHIRDGASFLTFKKSLYQARFVIVLSFTIFIFRVCELAKIYDSFRKKII